MTEKAIEFRDFSKAYGNVMAVKDVSVDVAEGRVVGLLGGNGAGKTTCLRGLLGLVQPTTGGAYILGQKFTEHEKTTIVGASIDGVGFTPGATVKKELLIWARALGIGKHRVDEVLDLVGLFKNSNKNVSKLSQGMRQRLALGIALLHEPRIIVLDEPITGLDPAGIRWLRLLLRNLATKGVTVLLSSHILNEVEETVDDIIILQTTLRYAGSLNELTEHGRYSLEERFFELTGGDQGE